MDRNHDRIRANVEVSSMHFFDRFGDISIELVYPDGKKMSRKEKHKLKETR